MNSSTVLWTLTGIHSHVTLGSLLSGTIIRGTPSTPKRGWRTSLKQTIKTGKHGSKLRPHLPRDAIPSHPSPASGKNSSPERIHGSPGGPLRQWRTPGSLEAKLGQTLSYSGLGQIVLPPIVSRAHLMWGSPDTLS
jgi:hypothetical protein